METSIVPKIFVLDGLAVAELLSPGCKVDPYFLPEKEETEPFTREDANDNN